MSWSIEDSRALSVALVVRDGHRLPLRGVEREVAVEAMIARGLDAETMAERLRITPDALRAFARHHNIAIPKANPQPWWVAIAQPSRTSAAQRRQRREQADRQAKTVGGGR